MSIVKGIIDIAEAEAKKAAVDHFVAINLEIGTLAGIEFDALDFVWDIAVKDSVLEKAIKNAHKIHGKATCSNCKEDFSIIHMQDSCPSCGSFDTTIIQGKELRVKSLEII